MGKVKERKTLGWGRMGNLGTVGEGRGWVGKIRESKERLGKNEEFKIDWRGFGDWGRIGEECGWLRKAGEAFGKAGRRI